MTDNNNFSSSFSWGPSSSSMNESSVRDEAAPKTFNDVFNPKRFQIFGSIVRDVLGDDSSNGKSYDDMLPPLVRQQASFFPEMNPSDPGALRKRSDYDGREPGGLKVPLKLRLLSVRLDAQPAGDVVDGKVPSHALHWSPNVNHGAYRFILGCPTDKLCTCPAEHVCKMDECQCLICDCVRHNYPNPIDFGSNLPFDKNGKYSEIANTIVYKSVYVRPDRSVRMSFLHIREPECPEFLSFYSKDGKRVFQEPRFVKEEVPPTNDSVMVGFFDYCRLGEIVPLIVSFVKKDRETFNGWVSYLLKTFRDWRGKGLGSKLWSYFLANPDFVRRIVSLGFSVYSKSMIVEFMHIVLPQLLKAMDFRYEVSSVQGPSLLGRFVRNVVVGSGKWIYNGVTKNFDHISSIGREADTRETHYASKGLWERTVTEKVDTISEFVKLICSKIIILESAFEALSAGMYLKAFARLWASSANGPSVLAYLRGLVREVQELWPIRNWSEKLLWGGSAELDLEREWSSDEEEKEDVGNQVGVVLGPMEDMIVFRKFYALTTAIVADELTSVMPEWFVRGMTSIVTAQMFTSKSLNVARTGKEFFEDFMSRCVRFCENYDFNVFLETSGANSWYVRAHKWISQVDRREVYPSFREALAEGVKLEEECLRYLAPGTDKAKVPSDHLPLLKSVQAKVSWLKMKIEKMSMRKKVPYSFVMAGPPGPGKTYFQLNVFGPYICRKIDGSMDPDYKPATNEIYTVPMMDTYFNGCSKPNVLVFQDMKGDGHRPEGMNMPEMLRLAVDTEPFYTPQADIPDKQDNVIDPEAVFVSTNDMVWDFTAFGSDWSKLGRRYGHNVYYVAYPEDCYLPKTFSDLGSSHGTLKPGTVYDHLTMANRLRYYQCEMTFSSGKVYINRTKLACVGFSNFENMMMRSYYDYRNAPKPPPRDVQAKCCEGKLMSDHAFEMCTPDCDYLGRGGTTIRKHMLAMGVRPKEPFYGPIEDPLPFPEVGVVNCGCVKDPKSMVASPVNIITDKVSDRLADRYSKKAAETFGSFKEQLYLITKIFVGVVLAIGTVYVGVNAYRTTAPRKPKTELPKEGAKTTEVSDVQAVLRPVAMELPKEHLLRFGIKSAPRDEIPNPQNWVVTTREYATFSKVSNTSKFADVERLVINATYKFRKVEGGNLTGTITWISSNYAFVSTHVYRLFKDKMVEVVREHDNDFKLSFHMTGGVSNRDMTIIKTPVFPGNTADLLKHMAMGVGNNFVASMNGTHRNTRKVWMNFIAPAVREKLPGYDKEMVLQSDPLNAVNGDCGTFLVADVNGLGVIVGFHFGLDTEGNALFFELKRDDIEALIKIRGGDSVCVAVQNVFEGEFEPLHKKSPIRHAAGVSMRMLGTFGSNMKPAKCKIQKSALYDLFYEDMIEKKVIPNMQRLAVEVDGVWLTPWTHKFSGMTIEPFYPPGELEAAVLQIAKYMPVSRTRTPLTLAEAIKGVDGDPYIKGINMQSSSGRWNKQFPDKSLLIDKDASVINEELAVKITEIIPTLVDHVPMAYQNWCLKSEVVTEAKESIMKYRVFMVSDLEWLIVARIFLAPVISYIYSNRHHFHAYGGFNPASPEFGDDYAHMERLVNLILADIKHMDSSHRADLAEAVATLMALIAKHVGYNDMAVQVVKNIMRATVLSVCTIGCDAFVINEGMGSGLLVTFIFNCMVLAILYYVAWMRISTADFRNHNFLQCGGDDSALATRNPAYTAIHCMKVFAEYGYVVTTPTNKHKQELPFYRPEDYVFLKRSPRRLVFNGKTVIVGALDKDSIYKSICFEEPSPNISRLDRMCQVLDAARREMALHGESHLEAFDRKIPDYWKMRLRPHSWYEIMERYVVGKLYADLDKPYTIESQVSVVNGPRKRNFDVSLERLKRGVSTMNTIRTSEPLEEKHVGTYIGSWPVVAVWVRNHDRVIKTNRPADYTMIGGDSLNVTNQKTTDFQMASGMASNQAPIYSRADYGGIKKDISLETSLSRPTLVSSFSWTSSSPVRTADSTDVYEEWKNDTFNSSKLFGFKLFRGRPVLRVVVNGLSFYHGKLLIAVDMGPGYDGTTDSNVQTNSFSIDNISQAVMAPHVAVDPSKSCTYDLKLPFYSATGWYNLFRQDRTPTMQILYFVQNALSSADGNVSVCDIKVYLMMEDVELSVPAVAAILGPVAEEEEPSGVLSKPLMIASRVAGFAKNIPFLSEFAAPAEIALSMGSALAHFLGYSAPVVLEGSRPTLNLVAGNVTYMDDRKAITKLTADPRQAVAVSAAASTVGSDDDMLIASITTRPGYVEKMVWSSTGLTGGIPIYPGLTAYGAIGTNVQFTPIGWISRIFSYWSGSIVVRIEVIASGFHRGTFGASWIPYTDPPGGNPLDYPNRYLTTIIDITETKVVDFVIPFAGDAPNLPISEPNGQVLFYEINPLRSSMVPTSPVEINLYMMAGPDYQLYRPSLANSDVPNYGYYTVGGVNCSEGEVAAVFGDSEVTTTVSETVTSSVTDETLKGREKIYFGEVVTSIKQLCNRDCRTFKGKWTGSSSTSSSVQCNLYPFPLAPLDMNSHDAQPVYVAQNYVAYLAPAFLAMRGGMRHKVVFAESGTASFSNPQLMVKYAYPSHTGTPFSTEVYTKPFFLSTVSTDYIPTNGTNVVRDMARSSTGAILDSNYNHPALEFEMPYTNSGRFINSRKQGHWYKPEFYTGEIPKIEFNRGPSNTQFYEVWTSAADDFSLHGFFYIPEMKLVTYSDPG